MHEPTRWIAAVALAAPLSMPALAADGDAMQSSERDYTIIERNSAVSPMPLTSPGTVVSGRLQPRDYVTPDDLSRYMPPSEASRWTGRPDTESAPPRTGTDEQPGNMGPNSSKSQ